MSGIPSTSSDVNAAGSPALPASASDEEASPSQQEARSSVQDALPLPQPAPTSEQQAAEQKCRVLGRRYVVQRKAGAGGCSEVLMARDRQSGKLVAVKIFNEVIHAQVQYPMTPLDVLQAVQHGTMPWRREWEAYERLGATSAAVAGEAECIPRVYEAGVVNMPLKDDSGQLQPRYKCYMVMELLGHNLYELCAVYGKHRVMLTAQDFVALGQAMLRALQHVHICGLVHRDVKPSNFCLPSSNTAMGPDAFSHVYIMDFDFAVVHEAVQSPDARARFVGTPDYAAVRTLLSYKQTPLDDLESLCYSLLEMATGDLPWGDIEDRVPKRGPSQDGKPWTGWWDKELEYMAEFKEEAFMDAFAAGQVPSYLHEWMQYLNSLDVDAQPDYDHLAQLLERATDPSADGGPEVWHEGMRWEAAIAEGGLEGSGGKRPCSNGDEGAPAAKRAKADAQAAASGPSMLAMDEE